MDLVPRRYQLEIYNSILRNGNTLVVLPTGLGKTLIALMLINDYSKKGKCLFLSPTKPLCKQHADSIKKILKTEDLALVSGEVSASKRKSEYERPIIISTPQTIRNDIENRIFDPKSVLLCIFDEAHRSVGDYAYTQVSEALKDNALLVGLTASPGGRNDRIKEVLTTLNIGNVEIRTYEDEDVKEYAHDIDVE
ncbi:MAG: DEAD/DEAH box helicase family protein [Candidatus Bilamarchaeaceae archaeon]